MGNFISMAGTILFIHSAGPQGRKEGSGPFLSLLKKGLGPGYVVKAPKMPHPDAPDYEPWKKKLARELAKVEDGTILIGHSLGGSVLLKYLSEEEHGKSFAALFLIATPFWGLGGFTYKPFYLKRGFSARLTKVRRIFVYHAENDDVVSRAHLRRHAREIPKAKTREIPGFGHVFDTGECQTLMDDIRSIGSSQGNRRTPWRK